MYTVIEVMNWKETRLVEDPVLGDLSEETTTNIDINFVVDNYGQIIFWSQTK